MSARYVLDKGSRTPIGKEMAIPAKQDSPEDWNFHFENELLKKYGPDANLDAWTLDNPDTEMGMYMQNVTAGNTRILMESKLLLAKEGALVDMASEQLTNRDFEATWAALDVAEKMRIALDGIVRAACIAREKSRLDCPEMSVLGLIGDGEYSLVNLLKAIIAHDPAPTFCICSIYLFPHPEVEQEYHHFTTESAADDCRAFGHLRILQRNAFLVQALTDILKAYAGVPAKMISIQEDIETESRMMHSCFACRRIALGPGMVILKRCSGCKVARYCSKSCQTNDWRLHKKLCGSFSTKFDPTLVIATSAHLAPVEFIGCPAPAPGFVRSPALWRQISLPHSLMFLVTRRRAMASGDRGAVCKMHSILEDVRLNQDIGLLLTADQLRRQLEREYCVTLIQPDDFGPPPTEQEMLEEVGYGKAMAFWLWYQGQGQAKTLAWAGFQPGLAVSQARARPKSHGFYRHRTNQHRVIGALGRRKQLILTAVGDAGNYDSGQFKLIAHRCSPCISE
ncbi:hypothetical protein C8R45DRAFT_1079150 [Mycena sanguinolenta]|nr:hypothetical protein C8R45DRAFT_1079150 [Mycena sanguinolenta]